MSCAAKKLHGTFRWTLFEQPGELVCEMNPILVIATGGVEIRVEGRGYARRERPDDSLWQVAANVHINSTHRVEAMCAIDALGIAPMLQQPIEITSHDPLTGTEIWMRLDPSEGAWWEPTTAVVLAGSASCDGPSFHGCCDVLNLFETEDLANSYLAAHPELSGFPISIPHAIKAGRTVFADLMKEP